METKVVLQYLVNLFAVLEALTLYLEADLQAFNDMVEAMVTSRRREVEDFIKKQYARNEELIEFCLAKYRTMAITSQQVLASKAQNKVQVLFTLASSIG